MSQADDGDRLPGAKRCRSCGVDKPLDAYGRHKGGRFGLHPRCKECRQAAERLRYESKRQEILAQQKASAARQEWRRNTERLRRYGISLDRYRAAVEAQGGRCAACGDEAPLCVDHDHSTGEVRGLLCSPCNLALGHFRDDPGRLVRAFLYLTDPPGIPS